MAVTGIVLFGYVVLHLWGNLKVLAGPGAHHNYQLWWLPFYALALGAALTRPHRGLQNPAVAL